MVGMVVTISPSLSLYKMVVLPAASRPTVTQNKKNIESEARSEPKVRTQGIKKGRREFPGDWKRARMKILRVTGTRRTYVYNISVSKK